MSPAQYRELAADFRARARAQECPAFREELEDLARCYESAAEALDGHDWKSHKFWHDGRGVAL